MASTLARYVTPEEMAACRRWREEHLLASGVPPFSFTFGGRPVAALLAAWTSDRYAERLADGNTRHTVRYTDPATGLEVRCQAVEYRDFPTVEWTLYFRNRGGAPTPILQEIRPLDVAFPLSSPDGAPVGHRGLVIHHAVGSPARADDYRPLETALRQGASLTLAARGGRPSDTDLPFFNLEWPGGGLVVAIGWPGQWIAHISREAVPPTPTPRPPSAVSATAGAAGGSGSSPPGAIQSVRVRAGQELTHFSLQPGEEVRTPLLVLQFYRQKDWIGAQNVWRRWMLAFGTPRVDGAVPAPFTTASSSAHFSEMERANEENQQQFIDQYVQHGVALDYWWMDAGWYVLDGGRWPRTGTWEVDRERFPRGLRAVADHAHAQGVKILVWFEPERVAADTWLDREHPEWLLSAPGTASKLLDLGNPAAWQWAVEHFDRLVVEQGIDLYRQDFNMGPLAHWRAADAPDRQGLAEIRHVTGYLAFWDELRRRHPGMLIDTCASGGRRTDLETLRRAVPLHPTDHDYQDYTARQSHTYGLSLWLPLFGSMVCKRDQVDEYAVRSAVGIRLGMGFDVRRQDLDWPRLCRLIDEWRATAPALYGDFYPLTAYSIDQRDWLAYQHDVPERGEGVVRVYRRAASPYVLAQFRLRGLDPDATYAVTDLDAGAGTGNPAHYSGRALLEEGLSVGIEARPCAKVFTYRQT
jgi:alpha-galactosidase